MSEVMHALYRGHREEAEAAAVEDELDVFEAASLGRHPRLAELLRGDASLALAWSDDGFTALHYACFFGTPDCTTTLLDAGALIDEPSRNDMGVRPINAAAAGARVPRRTAAAGGRRDRRRPAVLLRRRATGGCSHRHGRGRRIRPGVGRPARLARAR